MKNIAVEKVMMQMTEYEITVLLVFLSLFAGGFIDRHKKKKSC